MYESRTTYQVIWSPVMIATPVFSVWVETFSQLLAGDSAGWNGFNLRVVIQSALLSESGSRFRMTLDAGSAGEGASIDSIYAGHSSAVLEDFDGTQVPVTVGGNGSFLIPVGTQLVTDGITYAFDRTRTFVIAAHFDSAANDIIRNQSLVNAAYYNKAGASEASVSDVSGYTITNNAVALVSKIEVLQ